MADPTDTPAAPSADPVTGRALERLRAELPSAVVDAETAGRHPWIRVEASAIRAVARLMRDDPALQMDCCHLISAVDYPDEGAEGEIEVIYHLCSYALPPDAAYRARAGKNDPWVAIKVRVPRDEPEVPTVMDVWTGADWHERETWDLMGVRFTQRKELFRILLPEDWPGHPLRKDWQYPASYHGVPIIPPEGL